MYHLYLVVETLPCASNPCQNGATCFDNNGGSGYVCLCPAGFEGTNCENGMYSSFRVMDLAVNFHLFSWICLKLFVSYIIHEDVIIVSFSGNELCLLNSLVNRTCSFRTEPQIFNLELNSNVQGLWDPQIFDCPQKHCCHSVQPLQNLFACASHPCQNGATCFNHNCGSGYICLSYRLWGYKLWKWYLPLLFLVFLEVKACSSLFILNLAHVNAICLY